MAEKAGKSRQQIRKSLENKVDFCDKIAMIEYDREKIGSAVSKLSENFMGFAF